MSKWLGRAGLIMGPSRLNRVRTPSSLRNEWLILKSGIVHAEHLADILENPGDFIESQKFFSWENFFEDFLVQETRRTPFQYAKSNLNDVYKQKANQKRIAAEIMDVD